MSSLRRVLAVTGPGDVEVEDLDGVRSVVSLLAYDGPAPGPGSWVVCHSGFVLVGATEADARSARQELERAGPRRAAAEPNGEGP